MLPLDITTNGKLLSYLIFGLIGFGFGTVLELAGFGNARKLAAQFYFKDMTVLKTMFTGILVACLLMFTASALGYLDFSKIFVNQTYLWPGIVGGLIMGVGFVIGGYCPGTSVVSAASFKIDGMVFLGGTVLGAGLFGETVGLFPDFWNASFTERLLLSDWFGWSIGAVVFGVAVMALGLFYVAEVTEGHFRDPAGAWDWKVHNRRYVAAVAVVLAVALFGWVRGQPGPERKWQIMGAQYQPLLDKRDVFIHPLEYAKTWNDAAIKLVTLDLRPKRDFDAFHLDSAKHIATQDLSRPDIVFGLDQLPPQGVVVLIADDERDAVQAWKWLKVQGVTNLYILEHGMKTWNQTFASVASGHLDLARPSAGVLKLFPKDAYTTKIKLKTSRRAGGLCS